MKRSAFSLIELLVCLLILVILIGFLEPSGRGFCFCFGWIAGIGRLINGLSHEPAAVMIGAVALVLSPIFLHGFLHRLPISTFQTWRPRQSVAVVGIACSLMIATIGIIMLIHEIYWINHPTQPMSVSIITHMRTSNHLKGIGRGTHKYCDEHNGTLPSGGTIFENGRPGHGWMTQLLPYIEQESLYGNIDLQKPWDDPVNAAVFQTQAPDVLRTSPWRVPEAEYRDAEGYALTDLAANERVMPFGRSLRLDEITDGISDTILCGEVQENFKPWGSPFNSRDPAIGINTSPDGFGSRRNYKPSVQFAMCDGSVQRVSADIDPQVLRAMATPNDRDNLSPKEGEVP